MIYESFILEISSFKTLDFSQNTCFKETGVQQEEGKRRGA